MDKKIEYKLDIKTGIFYKFYFGDIYFEDLIASWDKIIKQRVIPPDIKKFVIDYRETNIKFEPARTKDIALFYNQHNSVFGQSKIALIMVKPEHVVFPLLVESEGVNFIVKPFYTMEAALDWLT